MGQKEVPVKGIIVVTGTTGEVIDYKVVDKSTFSSDAEYYAELTRVSKELRCQYKGKAYRFHEGIADSVSNFVSSFPEVGAAARSSPRRLPARS